MHTDQAGEFREQVRADTPQLADAAAELGAALGLIGENAEAERLLRQAIGIYESSGDPDYRCLAASLSSLGAACAARGRLAEAERLYRRALQLVTQNQAR